MNYLLLTLGHGSSAIFVDNSAEQQKVIGYEQERLSGIKADSQFPIDAINEIEHNIGIDKMKKCVICVSHWFNHNTSDKILNACKYMTANDIEKLMSYEPNYIFVTDSGFTHHDAHAYSAYAFYDYHKYNHNIHKPLYCIVADGFGTNEEVLSIYCRRGDKEPELIHRTYGYQSSLGLFYQYATAYVGMKENQDEYKFLGYEAHIDEEFNEAAIKHLDECIMHTTLHLKKHILKDIYELPHTTDDVIDFDNLSKCRKYWYAQFDKVLEPFDYLSKDSFAARCAIAYFIQQTVENVFKMLIDEFKIDDVCVVGGCFYNVKLNNKILSSIKGDFCAMPLAGDQGAAIGMYKYIARPHEKQFEFGTLCWGKRRMYNAKKLLSTLGNTDNVIIVDETQNISDEFINVIAKHIADNRIINLVRGNMEFGPRALCNTSTLMLPSTENVAINNKMNNRNEVMPCAPVCTYKSAAKLFDTDELERVVGSDKYMICTHNYIKPYSKTYGGVMHHKTLEQGVFTGRPQIVSQDDKFMVNLLYKVEEICDAKCLVNTSFNAHGNPIVFDVMDIIRNFKYQCEHIEYEKRPILVVIL